MKNLKKVVTVVTVVGMLGVAGVAYAATAQTPAEIAAGLTGKTVENVYKERAAGKTFGAVANEAGKLEQFKTQMLEHKKAVLDQRVKDGKLTQTQADETYNAIKNNQTNCDGTGSSSAIGKKYGAGFGQGSGMGNGQGNGKGAGMHNGGGKGMGKGMNRQV